MEKVLSTKKQPCQINCIVQIYVMSSSCFFMLNTSLRLRSKRREGEGRTNKEDRADLRFVLKND